MPRDYAKYRVHKPAVKKSPWRGRIILFSVVAVVIVIGVFAFSFRKTEMAASDNLLSQLKIMLSHHKSASSKKLHHLAEQDTPEPVHFEFYDELPNLHVTPSIPTETTPPPPPSSLSAKPAPVSSAKIAQDAKPTTQYYFLQVGLYPDSNSAGQARLSYLLNGLETEVVQVTENGKEAYRLQEGPYLTQTEAKTAQKQLQRKGIDSVIKSPS